MHLIDNILLAPYSLFLRARHFLYDHGILKVSGSGAPSVCVGNITVGGTGKTPHTEMLLRLLQVAPQWKDRHIAVLSRGYMRKSTGFLEVTAQGNSKLFGDEPLQVKKKFPGVTVAVDKDRVHGCRVLCGEGGEETARKADLIILEDAFQYRPLRADVNIVLVDYNRPIFKDSLLPAGHLRDLPGRIRKADIVIVSKCPSYLKEAEANDFTDKLGFNGYTFFTTTYYDNFAPVFPEGDYRYTHSKRLILFTGIANDDNLMAYLSLKFRVVKHFQFGDHHRYNAGDISLIKSAAEFYATAIIMTTEKDAQRIIDCKGVPDMMKERLFYVPIYSDFVSPDGERRFMEVLNAMLQHRTGTQDGAQDVQDGTQDDVQDGAQNNVQDGSGA